MASTDILLAPMVVEYPYSRTVGPALGAFFTGMREGIVVGVRLADGRVMVPPTEYDPVTSEELSELVEVSDAGVVTTWNWVAKPREKQPLDKPFAYALVKLDGADIAMLHAVDVASKDEMSTGMRVKARWAAKRVGSILDIEAFVPEAGGA